MFDRQPEITASDLPQITNALRIFSTIRFNTWGDMYATVSTELPMFGNVVISCILAEGHVKIYRSDQRGSDAGIWCGHLHDLGFTGIDNIQSLADLVSKIRARLREETNEALA